MKVTFPFDSNDKVHTRSADVIIVCDFAFSDKGLSRIYGIFGLCHVVFWSNIQIFYWVRQRPCSWRLVVASHYVTIFSGDLSHHRLYSDIVLKIFACRVLAGFWPELMVSGFHHALAQSLWQESFSRLCTDMKTSHPASWSALHTNGAVFERAYPLKCFYSQHRMHFVIIGTIPVTLSGHYQQDWKPDHSANKHRNISRNQQLLVMRCLVGWVERERLCSPFASFPVFIFALWMIRFLLCDHLRAAVFARS